ncbi:hypothetical protein, partial [Escherichia coli]|uniref:hypothetical protein n=1 Tax=Escherichia coli TaxID=562 RepID=UPI0020105E53
SYSQLTNTHLTDTNLIKPVYQQALSLDSLISSVRFNSIIFIACLNSLLNSWLSLCSVPRGKITPIKA